jgi:hypothetical protein
VTFNTSFRPTGYRDLHLGGAWNAYLNWLVAARSGGEFVLIQDDLWMHYGATGLSGFGPREGMERYAEDLAWLGMPPNRCHLSSENRERHLWANAKLGYREPLVIGQMPILSTPVRRMLNPCDFNDRLPPAPGLGIEGYIYRSDTTFSPWHLTCCVVDSVDFRINAWVAGDDQVLYDALCIDLCQRLGYPPPLSFYHPNVKRTEAVDKLSKSGETVTIRDLRAAGYTAESILSTLMECSRLSYNAGHQSVVLPEGVLELGAEPWRSDRAPWLRHRNPDLEDCAAGIVPEDRSPDERAAIMAEAQRRLREGVDAVRTL